MQQATDNRSMLDPAQLKSKATYPRPGAFYSLAGNLANRRLYAGNSDHSIQVFDLTAEKKEPAAVWTKHDNFVSALAFVPRPPARLAISGSYDRTLVWWDADLGEVVRTVAAHEGWVRGLEPFPDGCRLASVGDDMLVRLWETDSGKPAGSSCRPCFTHAARASDGAVCRGHQPRRPVRGQRRPRR